MTDQPDKTKVLTFVCLVIFLDALGVGLILRVTPQLIAELTNFPNNRAAEISGYLLFAFAGTQFFFAPILGGLSDQYGRRGILLVSLLGFTLNYVLMAVAPTLAWMFVARVLSGITGATFAAANASIADVTTPTERARVFGLTGAALGLGFIFGPTIGGLCGEYSSRLPFLAAGVLTFAACVYGYVYFPETLSPEKHRPFELARANPLGSVRSVARYQSTLPMLLAFFLVQVASQSYGTIWAFYTIEVAHWTPFAIGLSAGVYGMMMVLVQGFLTGPTIKRIGEWNAIWLGLAMALISFAGFAFVTGPIGIYAFIVIGGFAGFFFPALQSLMTRSVPENAQGELQGAVASNFSVAAIVGPIMMPHIFSAFTEGAGPHYPGAPFAAATVLVACAAAVLRLWAHQPVAKRA